MGEREKKERIRTMSTFTVKSQSENTHKMEAAAKVRAAELKEKREKALAEHGKKRHEEKTKKLAGKEARLKQSEQVAKARVQEMVQKSVHHTDEDTVKTQAKTKM